MLAMLLLPENKLQLFFQIFLGDSLHEMSNPISAKNKKHMISLSSTELAQRVLKVKVTIDIWFVWQSHQIKMHSGGRVISSPDFGLCSI